MQQQWKSIMSFVRAAGILCVGIWMVADGKLNGLAAILFGALNVLIAILAFVRTRQIVASHNRIQRDGFVFGDVLPAAPTR